MLSYIHMVALLVLKWVLRLVEMSISSEYLLNYLITGEAVEDFEMCPICSVIY